MTICTPPPLAAPARPISQPEPAGSPEAMFADLIPCDTFQSPFIDRCARFGIVFDQGRALGPGMVGLRSAAFTVQPSDALLGLWLEEDGTWIPVGRRHLRHLPWQVVEHGDAGGVRITATHAFLDERTLVSTFAFRNTATAPRRIRPGWFGNLLGDRYRGDVHGERRFGIAGHPPRRLWATSDGDGVCGGLRDPLGILPQPTLRIRGPAGAAAGIHRGPHWIQEPADTAITAGEGTGALHYRFIPAPLALGPGEEAESTFTSELAIDTHLGKDAPWCAPEPGRVDIRALAERNRGDFLARVGWPAIGDAAPALAQKLWRARWALLRTGLRASGPAGEYGEETASTCVPNHGGFTRVFFWDSLFTSVALSAYDPDFAKGAIRCVFARQDPRTGLCPEHSFNFQVPGRDVIGAPQMPIAAWAVRKYHDRNPGDIAFVREMLPRLLLNHDYWRRHGDRDGDGLAELTWTGQCADNSPAWDQYQVNGGDGCTWLPPIANVQLNAFLYRDAVELADLAERCGDGGAAAELRASAAARGEALMRVCFAPREDRFWDFDHATGRHCRIRTFYMFWPLWAGMPVPEEARRSLIEDVLLDPRQFFGPIPFPSVAYDEPAYDPKGYWRGRCWPHISYWLIEMLHRKGYQAEAAEASRRTLAAILKHPGFPENLDSDPHHYEVSSAIDYNWGVAAVLMLAGGDWRIP